MISVETRVTISQPIERVFAFIAQAENEVRWRTETSEKTPITPGPIGVGTRYRNVGQFLGRRIEFISEVTAYEPNQRYADKIVSGPIALESHYALEPAEGGSTQLIGCCRGNVDSFFELTESLLSRHFARQLKIDFAILKGLLEGAISSKG